VRAKAWLLLACLPSLGTGCYSFDDGSELVAAAEAGEPRAIHELGELADPRIPAGKVPPPALSVAYETLAEHLQSDDGFVRIHTVEALRRLTTRSRAVYRDRYPGLLDPALSDPVADVRWRAAWALGRLELTSAALRAAALDPNVLVAERAVWALGRARDEDAPPFLLRALDREPLQAAAMRALRRVTGLRLDDDPEAWRRSAAEAGIEPASDPAPPGE
jgi:HEAT repeat protein